ncbi:MAG: translesion error-prone DNA polymerase V autoproteolytic subunit [Alphaproteobacteria bacterium]|nr:translesion error-prone DNA polymerase V autoproteolytic subunit [Alphaproteobacteria bacterium]
MNKQRNLSSSAKTKVPFMACRVSAGFPSPADDFIEGSLDLNSLIEQPAATYFLRASGHSMIGAGIFDGDLLIVDRSITPRSGHIVIATIHGEFTVKRLVKGPGGQWRLEAENSGFLPMDLPDDSEIWGVVKNSIRDHER